MTAVAIDYTKGAAPAAPLQKTVYIFFALYHNFVVSSLIKNISCPYTIIMNRLKNYTIKGIIFVIITGTISHFVYEWFGNNPVIGFFFPINESTWEHMKLIFFPMLLYSFYMNRNLKEGFPCVTSALFSGVLLGTLLIPVIFYTYTGILGKNTLPLDIATFIISVVFAFTAAYRLTLSCRASSSLFFLKLSVFILFVCFLLFTYRPLPFGIFVSPGNE